MEDSLRSSDQIYKQRDQGMFSNTSSNSAASFKVNDIVHMHAALRASPCDHAALQSSH